MTVFISALLASAITLAACKQERCFANLQLTVFKVEMKTVGESASLLCSTVESSRPTHAKLFKASQPKATLIATFYREDGDSKDTFEANTPEERMNVTDLINGLSIVLMDLKEEDSGVYWCDFQTTDDSNGNIITSCSQVIYTLVVQKSSAPADSDTPTTSDGSALRNNYLVVLFCIIITVFVLLMFAILLVLHVVPKIKKLSGPQSGQSRPNDSVYEVMSATLRR